MNKGTLVKHYIYSKLAGFSEQTVAADDQLLFEAIKKGASGFLLKNMDIYCARSQIEVF